MLFFGKSRKENASSASDAESKPVGSVRNERPKPSVRGKFFLFTGLDAVGKVGRSFAGSAQESRGRITSLWSSLNSEEKREVRELDDPEAYADDRARFSAAMSAQHLNESNLVNIRAQTHRLAWLYAILSFAFLIFYGVMLALYPPSGVYSVITRLGPFPVLLALIFKNCYVNWIVRSRRAAGPREFFKAKDWFPKA